MIVTTTAPILNLAGVPMKETDAPDAKPSTLGSLLVSALLAPEDGVTGAQKYERGKLAQRLFTDGDVKVSAEEAVILKACAGRVYPPLVVLRVFEALEG